MKKEIKKVAVLGAGVMGSQIAAHLANAGVTVLVYDISQELAERSLGSILNLKPAPYFDKRQAALVSACNYDDHLDHLGEVDWVIEAVVERLDIKEKVYGRIIPRLRKDAIISSNTSGLSLAGMAATMPVEARKRFLITHFFNPPRYMHLLEIVRGKDTGENIVKELVSFCVDRLGKGIVHAKDTPNFVANRIGVYGMMMTIDVARRMGLSIEEVDAVTGPALGRPKSATFRTADVVGIDTFALVAKTNYDKCPDDEARAIFALPSHVRQMLENKWVGQKAGQGFYKKEGKTISALDFKSMEYRPAQKVEYESLNAARKARDISERIRGLVYHEDRAGQFAWEIVANTLIYAANRLPEIADDIINIDNGLKWGFGWELGPFEIWDAIGVEKSVQRMKNEGKPVPDWISGMLAGGQATFYKTDAGEKYYCDRNSAELRAIPSARHEIQLHLEKQKKGMVLAANEDATLIDTGDGVLCAEFHRAVQPALNPLSQGMFDVLAEALKRIPADSSKGLIIANQAANFSAGADLYLLLQLSREQNWKKIDEMSKGLQDLCQALKYAPFPVVSAPHNLTLGGGLEIAMAADRMVASAELYAGLVEVGVGLIPGGGGNMRVLTNFYTAMARARTGPFPPVQKAFESIAFGKTSSSAAEGGKLGFLTRADQVVMNRDQLVFRAKQAVLEMSSGYEPPKPFDRLYLPGEGGRVAIEVNLDNMIKQGLISEHDHLIGSKLARVLTGGNATMASAVTEQQLLDLEREAFVSLCQAKKTQERMEHMLKTGKPLRN